MPYYDVVVVDIFYQDISPLLGKNPSNLNEMIAISQVYYIISVRASYLQSFRSNFRKRRFDIFYNYILVLLLRRPIRHGHGSITRHYMNYGVSTRGMGANNSSQAKFCSVRTRLVNKSSLIHLLNKPP